MGQGEYTSRTLIFMLLVMPGLLGGPTPAVADGQVKFARMGGVGACGRTTVSVFNACINEARDDYWIAAGNCENLANAAERMPCRRAAADERGDAREECGEQRDARNDVCDDLGQAPYAPEIDPAMFVDPSEIGHTVAPNPYLPLTPGITRVYEEEDETVTVTVTEETREILGVTCVVVRDVEEEDGEVVEDTKDWLAQDVHGNVWYFGEISRNFEDGELVDVDGSWTAGVDGAKPGILMLAAPAVGDIYRQEFALGDAEDLAEVLNLAGSAAAPAASCTGDCVITRDFSPIEPGHEEFKVYAPGVGLILEINAQNGKRVELVEIREE